MIGDSHTDIEPGRSIGMDSMLVLSGVGNLSLKKFKNNLWPNYIVNNLLEGADLIVQRKIGILMGGSSSERSFNKNGFCCN